MYDELSPNTEAALLLTAPLIAGKSSSSVPTLSPGEYKRLLRFLRDRRREPADLLTPADPGDLEEMRGIVDPNRIQQLLGRGFVMSQAIERWRTRAIWVVGHMDPQYPYRFVERLQDDAPPVLYGCGDAAILSSGGLAIVGSRHAADVLLAFSAAVGQLAADAEFCVISGAARGIDQAAMRGAIQGGGRVVGIMADSLERASLNRENRDLLLDRRLALVSPYDPSAGFNVGNAMQRNKLIYALADAALVVSSDYQTGGTWAGAVEQLERLKFVPVYVRDEGPPNKGLDALRRKGALPWPNPESPDGFHELMTVNANRLRQPTDQMTLPFSALTEPSTEYVTHGEQESFVDSLQGVPSRADSAEILFATVRSLMERMETPKSESEVAAELNVSRQQAREWLRRLVREGVVERCTRPVRYRVVSIRTEQSSLFDRRD